MDGFSLTLESIRRTYSSCVEYNWMKNLLLFRNNVVSLSGVPAMAFAIEAIHVICSNQVKCTNSLNTEMTILSWILCCFFDFFWGNSTRILCTFMGKLSLAIFQPNESIRNCIEQFAKKFSFTQCYKKYLHQGLSNVGIVYKLYGLNCFARLFSGVSLKIFKQSQVRGGWFFLFVARSL